MTISLLKQAIFKKFCELFFKLVKLNEDLINLKAIYIIIKAPEKVQANQNFEFYFKFA